MAAFLEWVNMNAPTNTGPSVSSAEQGSARSIGLATWNVRGFARPNIDDLGVVLNAEPSAIIVVQELQRSQAKHLARVLGMEHYWSFKHSPLGPLLPRFAEGLATFSTEPLRRTETLDITPKARAFSHRRRIAQFTYLDHLETDVVNIHLASHDDSSARLEQLHSVLEQLQTRGATRCIFAGDFNAAHEPSLYALMTTGGFADAWVQQEGGSNPADSQLANPEGPFPRQWPMASSGDGFTNPAGSTRSRLDRIFVRGFNAVSASVPLDNPSWAKLSDHLPVFSIASAT